MAVHGVLVNLFSCDYPWCGVMVNLGCRRPRALVQQSPDYVCEDISRVNGASVSGGQKAHPECGQWHLMDCHSDGKKTEEGRNSQDSPEQVHFFLPLPAMIIRFLLLQPWNEADPSSESPGGFCPALGLHHWSFMFHLRLQPPEQSVYDFLCSPAWDGHCGIINPINVWDSLTILLLWPYVTVW